MNIIHLQCRKGRPLYVEQWQQPRAPTVFAKPDHPLSVELDKCVVPIWVPSTSALSSTSERGRWGSRTRCRPRREVDQGKRVCGGVARIDGYLTHYSLYRTTASMAPAGEGDTFKLEVYVPDRITMKLGGKPTPKPKPDPSEGAAGVEAGAAGAEAGVVEAAAEVATVSAEAGATYSMELWVDDLVRLSHQYQGDHKLVDDAQGADSEKLAAIAANRDAKEATLMLSIETATERQAALR